MSQENVHVTKAGLAAANRGDIDGVQAAFHPDAEFRTTFSGVDEGVYRGPALAEQWLGKLRESFEDYRVEVDEAIGEGNRLVISIRNIGRWKGSSVPFEDRRYVALAFKDGKIWRAQVFAEMPEALEAAGLSE